MASHWSRNLKAIGACEEAVDWAKTQPSFKEAWATCERGDWMLWLAGKQSGKDGWSTHQQVVLAACDCAELSLKYVPKGENRPRLAIETARKWANGQATIGEVRQARGAAAYAAVAVAAAVAAAVYAAADATVAAVAAADAAAYAAVAAYDAAAYAAVYSAADATAYSAAGTGIARQCSSRWPMRTPSL